MSIARRGGSGPDVESLAQRLALEQFHHGVGQAVGVAEVVNREDAGVRQRRHRQRLALEARQPIRVGGKRLRQHLDGDVALQLGIARAVDVAHSAGADVRCDLVGTDDCSRLEAHQRD